MVLRFSLFGKGDFVTVEKVHVRWAPKQIPLLTLLRGQLESLLPQRNIPPSGKHRNTAGIMKPVQTYNEAIEYKPPVVHQHRYKNIFEVPGFPPHIELH